MADTNKGNVSSRASVNPSDMEESVLPIDTLGPNSLRKKKLLNEKIFAEISSRAYFATIQIYLMTAQILKQTLKQKQDEHAENIHRREIEKARLQETQQTQLASNKNHFNNTHPTRESLISLFDQLSAAVEKIKQRMADISAIIERKRHEIQKLEEKMQVARRDLSRDFSRIFTEKVSTASFKPMQLFLSLPKEFKSIRGSERYRAAYALDYDNYKELINEIADRINSGSIDPSLFESEIKKSVSAHVEKLITKNIGFLSENDKNEALSSMMKSPAVESFIESISKQILETSITDPTFREKMTVAVNFESILFQEEIRFDELKEQMSILKQFASEATSIMSEMSNIIKQEGASNIQDIKSINSLNLTQSAESLLANFDQELSKPLTPPDAALFNLQTETLSQLDALVINAEKLDALGELPAKRDELMATIGTIEDKFDAAARTKMAELYSNKSKQQPGAEQAAVKDEAVEETESFRPRLR